MAMTPEQRMRLMAILDQQSEAEVDSILSSLDRFTHFIYYACRDIFDAIHSVLKSTWNWIRTIFTD